MTAPAYDIVTVGGGLGGSALARAMAERGARVLMVEAERQFKDRVRGELMFLTLGPEADARRERALPLIAADQTRIPDFLLSGPDLPLDESVRRRFFGEE